MKNEELNDNDTGLFRSDETTPRNYDDSLVIAGSETVEAIQICSSPQLAAGNFWAVTLRGG